MRPKEVPVVRPKEVPVVRPKEVPVVRPKEVPVVPESPHWARRFRYPPIVGTGMTKSAR